MTQKDKRWYECGKCLIWIFNVGRGFCAFVRTPNNLGIMLDCGRSADFSPAEFLKENIVKRLRKYNGEENPIAQLFISHPHTDHFTDIENVAPDDENSLLRPYFLTCPNDKGNEEKWSEYSNEALSWDRVKNMEGTESLTNRYREMYKNRSLPLRTIIREEKRHMPQFEYGYYYIRPPVCEEEIYPENENDAKADLNYANSTSLVVYFRYGGNSILFPGDMPPEAMKYLLDEEEGCEKRFTRFNGGNEIDEQRWSKTTSNQPSLKSLLEDYGLTILVAPHHGLESGYSEYLYECMRGGKPDIVVISEKRHKAPQDGEIAKEYQSEVDDYSLPVSIEDDEGNTEDELRYSVSTRNNHHILISMSSRGDPKIMLRKTPDALLTEF